MKTTFAFLPFVALVACGPPGPDVSDVQTYLVYDYDSESETYQLHESEIRTFTDPRTVDGEIAFVRGGGSLVATNPNPQTAEELENAMEVRGDHEPSAEYVIKDGVAVPYDFDTQMMVTMYHHLERAADFFDGAGFATDEVGRLPVYFYPQVSVLGVNLPLLTDNAAYAFTMNAFLIPPRVLLRDDVPIMANRGVIVHEYSHAVFNRVVHQNDRVPDFLLATWNEQSRTEIRSLDEGVADVFAALAVGDPDFITASISAEEFEIDRDLRKKRVWNAALDAQVKAAVTPSGTNPYILGSVVGSTLWATRDFLDDETLAATMLAAMSGIQDPPPDFGIVDFFNAFLDAMPDEHHSDACNLFGERLELVESELDC